MMLLSTFPGFNGLTARGTGASLLLVLLNGAAQAQAPTITNFLPPRNANAAPRTTNVAVTFSQPLSNNAPTLGALRVFSQQAGGKKAGTATVSGNTLSFTPARPFRGGEQIFTTVTPAVQSSGGQNLASGQVSQFTTATTPSTGRFYTTGLTFANGSSNTAYNVVPADVDGDGDLDLVTSSGVRLNDGAATFGEAQPLPVSAATAFALGDLDADGDLDLLAVSTANTSVSVRLNNGSGTFSGTQEVSVGSYSVAITLGDVDADGDLDFVTTNNLSATATTNGSVSVRLNDGSGTFSGSQEITTGARPAGAVLGDLDQDGDVDLTVASYGTGAISVRRNNGLGSFGSGQELFSNAGLYQLMLGDMDNDGDLDLLSANSQPVPNTTFNASQIYLYRNDGTGTLGTNETIAGNTNLGYMNLGDLDGDGDLDVLAAYMGFRAVSGGVYALFNNGTGGFVESSGNTSQGQFVYTVGSVLGDFDNDGDLDYLINNYGSLTSATNQALPTITSITPTTGPVGTTIILTGTDLARTSSVTLNGVALPGFTINSATQITVIVPVGATSGPLVVTTPIGSVSVPFTVTASSSLAITGLSPTRNALAALRTGDVAVSFNQPLSSSASTQQALKVFGQQTGKKVGTATVSGNTLRFNPNQDFKAGETVYASVTRDVQNSSGENLTIPQVFQFTAATTPSTAQFTNAPDVPLDSPYTIIVGDLDGDGDLDLLSSRITVSTTNNTLGVRLNNGNGTFTNGQDIAISIPRKVILGDVDGDGDLDVVSNEGVRLNNGSALFGSPQQPQPGLGTPTLGDVDGDGDLDLLVNDLTAFSTPNGGTSYLFYVRVKLNNGSGSFSEVQQVPVGFASTQVVVGDVNNDGRLDLLSSGSNGGSGTVSVRLGTGFGSFATSGQEINASTLETSGLLLGDADADTDLDLVAMNGSSGATLLLNNGQGSFSNPRAVNLGIVSAAFGDVDGDGDLDLLGDTPNSVSVRVNDGAGNFSTGPTIAVNGSPGSIAMGDLDGNGTLDFVTSAYNSSSPASVRLNSQVLAAAPARLAGQVSLYPNPARTSVQLSLPAELARQPLQLSVLNSLGQVVLTQKLAPQAQRQVPLPSLAAGVYTLRLDTDQGVISKRLLIE